jgi:IclR family mhp operon transcriptional activator
VKQVESVKTIRAVERAFEVLRALQARPQGATLSELQAATGLSGPTLLRMLKTLISVQAVWRSTTDQRYRNSVQLQVLTRGMDPVERLADLAAPALDKLCQSVEWPSDLAIHHGDADHMTVLESTLRQSRFYVRRKRGRVRVNLLGSAAGTAFLAALADERRAALVLAARAGHDIHNAMVIAAGDLEQHVADARRRGYAARHPLYRGGSYNAQPRDDALDAIAVPVVCEGVVLGALNINWNRTAMTERDMVRRNLRALQAAARAIARAAAEHGLLAELPHTEPAASDCGLLVEAG